MRIITERGLILTVAKRWATVYSRGYYAKDPVKQGILQSLEMLCKTTCSAEDVNKIIGNDSWTKTHCNGCDAYTDWAIELGEPPDYESRTATLCRACFDKAVELVNQTKE